MGAICSRCRRAANDAFPGSGTAARHGQFPWRLTPPSRIPDQSVHRSGRLAVGRRGRLDLGQEQRECTCPQSRPTEQPPILAREVPVVPDDLPSCSTRQSRIAESAAGSTKGTGGWQWHVRSGVAAAGSGATCPSTGVLGTTDPLTPPEAELPTATAADGLSAAAWRTRAPACAAWTAGRPDSRAAAG